MLFERFLENSESYICFIFYVFKKSIIINCCVNISHQPVRQNICCYQPVYFGLFVTWQQINRIDFSIWYLEVILGMLLLQKTPNIQECFGISSKVLMKDGYLEKTSNRKQSFFKACKAVNKIHPPVLSILLITSILIPFKYQ